MGTVSGQQQKKTTFTKSSREEDECGSSKLEATYTATATRKRRRVLELENAPGANSHGG